MTYEANRQEISSKLSEKSSKLGGNRQLQLGRQIKSLLEKL